MMRNKVDMLYEAWNEGLQQAARGQIKMSFFTKKTRKTMSEADYAKVYALSTYRNK
jgi:hypothetical protein